MKFKINVAVKGQSKNLTTIDIVHSQCEFPRAGVQGQELWCALTNWACYQTNDRESTLTISSLDDIQLDDLIAQVNPYISVISAAIEHQCNSESHNTWTLRQIIKNNGVLELSMEFNSILIFNLIKFIEDNRLMALAMIHFGIVPISVESLIASNLMEGDVISAANECNHCTKARDERSIVLPATSQLIEARITRSRRMNNPERS